MSREPVGSISSPFLLKFLGKMATVSKDGTLGINSRPLGDISNQKSKTSVLKSSDSNFLSVPKT